MVSLEAIGQTIREWVHLLICIGVPSSSEYGMHQNRMFAVLHNMQLQYQTQITALDSERVRSGCIILWRGLYLR